MKKTLFTILLTSISMIGWSQVRLAEESELAALPIDSITATIGDIPESLDANVDSLLHSWHVQYFTKDEEYCHDDISNVYFPDSVYSERLRRLPRVIDLPYNEVVRDCIELYSGRKRNLVRYMLGMSNYFFPIIEPILDKYNLPIELKYLAVVESALNPVALSRVGACGLWQFMLPTGKMYGLEINSLVDERRDPVKSTEAACKYFIDMYEIYGDWKLVLASYNCGPGNVNKAIKRAGGKTNFWQIYSYLPKETRTYVPLFIAANYVMNYYCEHNLCPMQCSLPLSTDTVMVNNVMHFQQISDLCGIDMEEIRALNPQYKRDIIPGNNKPSVLTLPTSVSMAYVDVEDSVYRHKTDEYLPAYYASISGPKGASGNKERLTHIVKKGETLQKIANRYGVTASDIKKWNGLSSSSVRIGQKLRVNVDNGGIKIANKRPSETKGNGTTYTVKSGDSLYTIAKKFPGVTAESLKSANGLKDASIKPGQLLKIPQG